MNAPRSIQASVPGGSSPAICRQRGERERRETRAHWSSPETLNQISSTSCETTRGVGEKEREEEERKERGEERAKSTKGEAVTGQGMRGNGAYIEEHGLICPDRRKRPV